MNKPNIFLPFPNDLLVLTDCVLLPKTFVLNQVILTRNRNGVK